jgi:hypothetical protein
MQRRTLVSLVALQLVVACGYAVSAEDAKRPVSTAVPVSAAVAEPGKPGEELTLRITPRFVSAPGFLRSLIRVAPHADNRLMRVEIDSAGYYRSSEIQLDGASAPMSHFMDWKEVPAGNYDLIVTVMGTTGPRVVRHLTFQVLGLSNDQ